VEDKDKPGWRTDNTVKELGSQLVRQLVMKGYFIFHKNFFTRASGENLKEQIITQLREWKEEIRQDKNLLEKRFYSGKYNGKPDDLAMCIVGGSHMIMKWMNSAHKEEERNNRMY